MSKRTLRKTKNKGTRNSNLLAKPTYLGEKDIPMSIDLLQYDSSQVEVKNIPLQASLVNCIVKSKVNWFNVTGISDATEVNRICREFGLHGFDVKDLLADRRITKAVTYENVTFILMSAFYQDTEVKDIDDMQIAFILGKNFVVSFQEETTPFFEEVKVYLEGNNTLIREKSSDFLLYVLLNEVNLFNMNTILTVEDYFTEIESQLIMRKESENLLQYLHRCRVDYMQMKRSITVLREEYTNILRNANKLIKEENMVYFNDFDDRLNSTLGDLSSFYESLASLQDLYYNNNNMKMNEIMKRLTIVSTIFIPLTFMAGIWGMNFQFMPETLWTYGYLFAWVTFAIIAVLSYLWIRKQKWF